MYLSREPLAEGSLGFSGSVEIFFGFKMSIITIRIVERDTCSSQVVGFYLLRITRVNATYVDYRGFDNDIEKQSFCHQVLLITSLTDSVQHKSESYTRFFVFFFFTLNIKRDSRRTISAQATSNYYYQVFKKNFNFFITFALCCIVLITRTKVNNILLLRRPVKLPINN